MFQDLLKEKFSLAEQKLILRWSGLSIPSGGQNMTPSEMRISKNIIRFLYEGMSLAKYLYGTPEQQNQDIQETLNQAFSPEEWEVAETVAQERQIYIRDILKEKTGETHQEIARNLERPVSLLRFKSLNNRAHDKVHSVILGLNYENVQAQDKVITQRIMGSLGLGEYVPSPWNNRTIGKILSQAFPKKSRNRKPGQLTDELMVYKRYTLEAKAMRDIAADMKVRDHPLWNVDTAWDAYHRAAVRIRERLLSFS